MIYYAYIPFTKGIDMVKYEKSLILECKKGEQ